ncbi:uncharacterized protein LOC129787771 isoform X2 [Lutzomyia longipalpis]|uniref:uncharacterized protein LOC129787771 isoform X2 n=1 Tax=Lutzomyia longipalpis TaxID=7200 RepID=UPI00248364C5|nr:uncharacterized protein LOC129787771 isoform X2 [Lutzomyia longipalpis]
MNDPGGKVVSSPLASSRSILREINRMEIAMQAPQKSQQLSLRPEFEDLQPSSGNFIDNLHPEAALVEQEREGKSPNSEDHQGGSYCSALSSDDEAFVECHSYIGDQTVDNSVLLNATVDVAVNEKEVQDQLSCTFDSGTGDTNTAKSPGKADVNLIATEFVEEIVSKALSAVLPVAPPAAVEEKAADEEKEVVVEKKVVKEKEVVEEKKLVDEKQLPHELEEVNKTIDLLPSPTIEDKLDKTIEVDEKTAANSTVIIETDKKNISIDEEILKLTENLSKITIPRESDEKDQNQQEEEQSPCNFNGTFDVSMKSVGDLNETIVLSNDLPSNDFVKNSVSPKAAPAGELCEELRENPVKEVQSGETCKMPETELNVSRNGSFDESRDSPQTPSVASSVSNLANQPDSASNTFVENLITENVDFAFKVPDVPGDGMKKKLFGKGQQDIPADIAIPDTEFQSGNEFEFTESHFDYLLTRGNNCGGPIDRNSLLLRFDPLLNQPVPVQTQLKASIRQQQQQEKLEEVTEEEEEGGARCEEFGGDTPNLEDTVAPCMSENEEIGFCVNNSESSPVATASCEYAKDLNSESDSYKDCLSQASSDATMSVDVIKDVASDEVKSVVNINSEDSFRKEYKMAELEKKIKNEVLKTEDIEKKLKEAEAREENLLKRLTENQKTITKMTGVLEAYEKTIAELIAEKQQLIESYEKKCSDLQNERDVNFQHLTSLEATFTDLHAKYERSKQITTALKKSEENLMAEKKQCLENLQLQEQRYEKMKSHAMQQLELANGKLDVMLKTHGQETAKLKALLKKEEISRLSTNEQLIQKTRENEELVKICDELINGSAPTS